jgi:hypothetical protein
LETSLWSKIKWLWERIWDFKRKSYPLSAMGAKLIGLSVVGSPVSTYCISLVLLPQYQILGIEWSKNMMTWMTFTLLLVPMVIGAFMISTELKSLARNTARVLITGLPGASNDFPAGILSKSEQRFAREVIVLSVQDDDIEKQVVRYNSEVCVDLFKRFVLHHQCEKLYIGGLARIPFLVAYGVFLRNVSNVFYFDKIHRDTNWRLLNDEDFNIQLNDCESLPKSNEDGDVGIALGLSTPILTEHLPIKLQNCTALITPTIKTERNLILNQGNLQRISGSLVEMIDDLSRKSEVKRIHLFLSVQSSLAIEIGRRFQEGIHKTWIIHNFDGTKGQYRWALELSEKGVQLSKSDSS